MKFKAKSIRSFSAILLSAYLVVWIVSLLHFHHYCFDNENVINELGTHNHQKVDFGFVDSKFICSSVIDFNRITQFINDLKGNDFVLSFEYLINISINLHYKSSHLNNLNNKAPPISS